jgi:hypothetical protein
MQNLKSSPNDLSRFSAICDLRKVIPSSRNILNSGLWNQYLEFIAEPDLFPGRTPDEPPPHAPAGYAINERQTRHRFLDEIMSFEPSIRDDVILYCAERQDMKTVILGENESLFTELHHPDFSLKHRSFGQGNFRNPHSINSSSSVFSRQNLQAPIGFRVLMCLHQSPSNAL